MCGKHKPCLSNVTVTNSVCKNYENKLFYYDATMSFVAVLLIFIVHFGSYYCCIKGCVLFYYSIMLYRL